MPTREALPILELLAEAVELCGVQHERTMPSCLICTGGTSLRRSNGLSRLFERFDVASRTELATLAQATNLPRLARRMATRFRADCDSLSR